MPTASNNKFGKYRFAITVHTEYRNMYSNDQNIILLTLSLFITDILQFIYISSLYCLNTFSNLFFIPIPPPDIFQFLNCLIIKALAYRFCWNTTNNGIWLNIFCYNSPASYNCTVPNCDPR